MTRYYFFLFLVYLGTSCTPNLTIEGFDKEIWVSDKDGCNGERKVLAEVLDKHKDQLLGKDQSQIKALLGKPDMHEIYKRSQRFYIYSIDAGVSCHNYIADKTAANFTLRFNALGRVHEVVYYR